jgi:hypothetical protein
MFLILIPYISTRTQYVLDELFLRRLGIEFKVTEKEDYFIKSSSHKISYGNKIIEGCLNIPSVPLLYEENIHRHEIVVESDEKWQKIFFKNPFKNIPDFRQPTQFLNFDVFAASFYLLSRYEEYLPHKKDEHLRFKAENSLAFQNQFLEIPLVDMWANLIGEMIKKQYPQCKDNELAPKQKFEIINTIDIDFAYRYKGLSMFRNLKKAIRNILRFDFKELAFQINVRRGNANDPYDTFDYIKEKSKSVKTLLFYLLANKESKYDKNIPTSSPELRTLFSSLSALHECGLHPSYLSTVNKKMLQDEFETFKQITGKVATKSRQHFLKMQMPFTYHNLIQQGVKDDYTMAYASHLGFRASTCKPFNWFDLLENKETDLVIHSSCAMDVTLKNYLKLQVLGAIDSLRKLKSAVKNVDGNFIIIWHNTSLIEDAEWQGWREVYEDAISIGD